MTLSLGGWTSYLGTPDYPTLSDSSIDKDHCQVLLEVTHPDDPDSFLEESLMVPPENRVRVGRACGGGCCCAVVVRLLTE